MCGGGCMIIRGREGSRIRPFWSGVQVCSHAVFSCPGVNSDAQIATLPWVSSAGSPSQELVGRAAYPWRSRGNNNLHLK